MSRQEHISNIVSSALEYLQEIIEKYEWDHILKFRVTIGFEGMGPEISIIMHKSEYEDNSPEVDVQLWSDPHDDTRAILIYSAFDPRKKDDEIDHYSKGLTSMSEAKPHFDKAVQLFGLSKR